MPLVSRRVLSKNTEEKIYHTLWEAISKLKSKEEIRLFLNDLLSPIERIMIAKRLAVAVLLTKGYSYLSIKDMVKVSQETIAKVSITLNNNSGYKLTINKIAESEATKEFWEEIIRLAHRIGTRDTLAPEDLIKNKLGHKKKTLV